MKENTGPHFKQEQSSSNSNRKRCRRPPTFPEAGSKPAIVRFACFSVKWILSSCPSPGEISEKVTTLPPHEPTSRVQHKRSEGRAAPRIWCRPDECVGLGVAQAAKHGRGRDPETAGLVAGRLAKCQPICKVESSPDSTIPLSVFSS